MCSNFITYKSVKIGNYIDEDLMLIIGRIIVTKPSALKCVIYVVITHKV